MHTSFNLGVAQSNTTARKMEKKANADNKQRYVTERDVVQPNIKSTPVLNSHRSAMLITVFIQTLTIFSYEETLNLLTILIFQRNTELCVLHLKIKCTDFS